MVDLQAHPFDRSDTANVLRIVEVVATSGVRLPRGLEICGHGWTQPRGRVVLNQLSDEYGVSALAAAPTSPSRAQYKYASPSTGSLPVEGFRALCEAVPS